MNYQQELRVRNKWSLSGRLLKIFIIWGFYKSHNYITIISHFESCSCCEVANKCVRPANWITYWIEYDSILLFCKSAKHTQVCIETEQLQPIFLHNPVLMRPFNDLSDTCYFTYTYYVLVVADSFRNTACAVVLIQARLSVTVGAATVDAFQVLLERGGGTEKQAGGTGRAREMRSVQQTDITMVIKTVTDTSIVAAASQQHL